MAESEKKIRTGNRRFWVPLYFILLSFLATCCVVIHADLRLYGSIFGYQEGENCIIIFQVQNCGAKTALYSMAIICIFDSKSKAVLADYREHLGDIPPGEIRKYKSMLPDQFQWGDEIEIKIEFKWQ